MSLKVLSSTIFANNLKTSQNYTPFWKKKAINFLNFNHSRMDFKLWGSYIKSCY